MICAATGKRRGSVNRHSQVTRKILSDVGTRLAKRIAASVDRPRCNSQQFDQDQPNLAIFSTGIGKLNEEEKNAIYEQYRSGTPVETLAQRYRSKQTCILQVINEIRVGRIRAMPLDFIPNPQFSVADADNSILAEMPSADAQVKATRVPSGLPPYLASLNSVSLLTREQEGHLFRKFNYLKHKASKLRNQLDPAHAKQSVMDQIEKLYEAALAVKNQILQSNLRLVVSIAKRYVIQNDSFFELVSDGNISLMRSIDKFDFTRGYKISTYASWAIMRNFARTIPYELRQRDRFRTSHDEIFNASEEQRSNEHDLESAQRQREAQVRKMMDRLDEREQQIVVSRFGLGSMGKNREPSNRSAPS